jgi:hypothetical protein
LIASKSSNVQYIPVAHVWHLEVSDAYLHKETKQEALALAWFVPIRILKNSAARRSRGISTKWIFGMNI